MTQFLQKILIVRPEIAEREKSNSKKARQAMELRRLRDAAGLTEGELAKGAGIEIAEVRRLESSVGPFPTQAEIDLYRVACGTLKSETKN